MLDQVLLLSSVSKYIRRYWTAAFQRRAWFWYGQVDLVKLIVGRRCFPENKFDLQSRQCKRRFGVLLRHANNCWNFHGVGRDRDCFRPSDHVVHGIKFCSDPRLNILLLRLIVRHWFCFENTGFTECFESRTGDPVNLISQISKFKHVVTERAEGTKVDRLVR